MQHLLRQVLVLAACLATILILASGGAGVARASCGLAPQSTLLNDDIGCPKPIGSTPYSDTIDIGGATTAPDDPYIPCPIFDPRYKTVWYSYTPSHVGKLHVDTYGSGYDTVLAVWTGTRGSLVKVGCSNDAGGTKQSEVNALVMGGTTYYIEVAAYFPNQLNTTLVLNASFENRYNLLVNPGFELDSNADGKPDGWLASPGFIRLAWSGAPGGSYVGSLSSFNYASYYTNQAVTVTAGQAYRFLGYVYVSADCDGVCTFRMLARWRDGADTVIGTDTIYTTMSGTDSWYEMNKNLVAPPGATSVLMVPNVQNIYGGVLIDKFFFVEW